MAKKKPTPKKKPAAKATKATKAAKPKNPAAKPRPTADASADLAARGFFRGEYHWEADRDVPALDARVRLSVDHDNDVVTPEQAKAVELLLESGTPLRPLAVRAAYELMLKWVEGFRQRHPEFRGKPIGEKPFTRGCELKSVLFPAPAPAESKHAPRFVLTLFWPDDTRPCEVRFEWVKGAWVVTNCERT